MYGYIRPVKGELKVREYESFRGVYCGLCHGLRRRYGPACRFLVNYDFTFLAMLLAEPGPETVCARRCPYHPLRKTPCAAAGSAQEAAADYTVILAWWKLRDGVADKGFWGAMGCRAACRALKGAYRKAAARRPAFAAAAEENLRALAALEKARCPSIDETADKFARILQGAGGGEDRDRARILGQLLYHLGRIVYVLDAVDDLEADMASGAYNPLIYRFSPRNGRLSPEEEAALRQTLQHSHNSVSAAFALLEPNPYTGILSNTIYLGLPAVTQAVFSGTWRAGRKIHREGNRL